MRNMIKTIDEKVLDKIINIYQERKPEGFYSIDKTVVSQLRDALIPDGLVVLNDDETGFLILLPYDNRLAFNPWFFGGYPIGNDSEKLLKEGIAFYKMSQCSRLELIGDTAYLNQYVIPLPHAYDYVDMIKVLESAKSIEGDFKRVSDFSEYELKKVYHDAFSKGDARFYTYQTEEERKSFWSFLCYERACNDPLSLAYEEDGQLIGYILTYPEYKGNHHISCMCIRSDHFHRGIGRKLMNKLFELAYLNGDKLITLGTETNMVAYQLYIKTGFEVTQKRSYYLL